MRVSAQEADSAGQFRIPAENEWHRCILDSVEITVARSTGNAGWQLNWKCAEGKIRDTLWWTPKGQGIAAKKLLAFGGATRDGDEIDIPDDPHALVGMEAEIFVVHRTSEGRNLDREGKPVIYTNAEPDFKMTDASQDAWFGYRAATGERRAEQRAESYGQPPPPAVDDYMPDLPF